MKPTWWERAIMAVALPVVLGLVAVFMLAAAIASPVFVLLSDWTKDAV